MKDVLINLVVGILSQCTHLSNCHNVYYKAMIFPVAMYGCEKVLMLWIVVPEDSWESPEQQWGQPSES